MDYSDIFKRDQFICQYCGRDGKQRFEVWLYLSADHLLPVGHLNRNNRDFIVTACSFCNRAASCYFMKCEKESVRLDGLSPRELLELRRPLQFAEPKKRYRGKWERDVRHHQHSAPIEPLFESQK